MIYQYNAYKLCRNINLWKKYKHDAGWDIINPEKVKIRTKESVVVYTGLHIYIPKGLKGIIQSRSGYSINCEIEAGNAGVIDHGYTGVCHIKIYNNGEHDITIDAGKRIAQIVFDLSLTVSGFQMLKLFWNLFFKGIPQKIPELTKAEWYNLSKKCSAERGSGGLGHTG